MEAINIDQVTGADRLIQLVVDIDKHMAGIWLSRNSKNPRKINRNTVAAYAADMKAGKWLLNGEAIVFDKDGNLLNGQHRLTAVYESDVKIKSVVIWGVDPDCKIFDYGIKRRISQEFNCPNAVEAVANVVVNSALRVGNIFPKGVVRKYLMEHQDELRKAFLIVQSGDHDKLCRKRDTTSAAYVLLRTGNATEDELLSFFKVANSGFPIDGRECSSAIVLARDIRNAKAYSAKNHIRRNPEFVIRAFYDFKNGVKRKVAYNINDTKLFDTMLDQVRKMDGLED